MHLRLVDGGLVGPNRVKHLFIPFLTSICAVETDSLLAFAFLRRVFQDQNWWDE